MKIENKDWKCPTCGCVQPKPKRPKVGTRVRDSELGLGTIHSYDQCDDVSCGVIFDNGEEWCLGLNQLEVIDKN